MRDKLYRFMQGRNGMDELARMQSWLVLILLLVGMFTRIGLFSFVALILMIYMYFRVFSRNTSKRYEENQKYLNFRYNRTVSWNRFKKRMGQARDYRFFKCPMCKQEVRVPRGHGKIEITCRNAGKNLFAEPKSEAVCSDILIVNGAQLSEENKKI